MIGHLNDRAVDARIDVTLRLALTFEPGAWIVRDDGKDYTVTSIQGVIDARTGVLHLAFPKGVQRRAGGGTWGAHERILHRVLPRQHPSAAWDALPAPVRDLIQDAYLLAREDLVSAVGNPIEVIQ